MKPKIIHDFIHWSDSDLQLTDILDEYTVSESDSDLSGLENATKRRKTSANETTQKNNHKVTKPSSKTGEQKKKSCTYMCPSCEKILKTIPGFRGHVQKQHGLMNLKGMFNYSVHNKLTKYTYLYIYIYIYIYIHYMAQSIKFMLACIFAVICYGLWIIVFVNIEDFT